MARSLAACSSEKHIRQRHTLYGGTLYGGTLYGGMLYGGMLDGACTLKWRHARRRYCCRRKEFLS